MLTPVAKKLNNDIEPDDAETMDICYELENGWCPRCKKIIFHSHGNTVDKATGEIIKEFWQCIKCDIQRFTAPPRRSPLAS